MVTVVALAVVASVGEESTAAIPGEGCPKLKGGLDVRGVPRTIAAPLDPATNEQSERITADLQSGGPPHNPAW